MQKPTAVGIVLPIIVAGSLFLGACARPTSTGTDAADTAAPTTIAAPTRQAAIVPGASVVVDGLAAPIQQASLTFEKVGTVAEIYVREGQLVKAGDPLVRLDTGQIELGIAQAEAALSEARANYEGLLETASPEEIEQLEALVRRAEADLQRTRGQVIPKDTAVLEAEIKAAKLALDELRVGPKPEEIEQAKALLEQERRRLELDRDTLSANKTRIQLKIEQLANVLRDAQDRYSRIYWLNQDLRDGGKDVDQERLDAEATALRDVRNVELAIESARVDLEEARQAEIEGIQLGEARVTEAQAYLERVSRNATEDEIAAAEARVARAELELARLSSDQRTGSIGIVNADLDAAKARLAALTADPSPSELASAKARIDRAEVELQAAQLQLETATLRAPFDGTVIDFTFSPGVASNTSDSIVLADLSEWQIETEVLSELDVAKIREGDSAVVTIYAIPGVTLRGTVINVKAVGTSDVRAGTRYRAMIALSEIDARLRWNMTASVAISPRES